MNKNKSKKSRRPTEAQKAAAQEKRAAFKILALQLSGELQQGKHKEKLARVQREQSGEGIARYSELNQLMILAQYPEATETYGFVEWHRRGYHPKKGVHGIAIRAPHERKSTEATEEGEESSSEIGFHFVYVYDITQVERTAPDAAEESPTADLATEHAKAIAEEEEEEEEEKELIRAEEELKKREKAEPATV